MSWFSQALSSSELEAPPVDTAPPSMGDLSHSMFSLCSSTMEDLVPHAGRDWQCPHTSSAPPSSEELPSPPSLGELSSSSLDAGPSGGPMPVSYVTLQEQRCVLSWFHGWTPPQKERFLQDLLSKAVPGKVCTLLEQLNTLQVRDHAPNIFECQLRLWSQWFESWAEEERNTFLHALEEKDPAFIAYFYRAVAGTAGRD